MADECLDVSTIDELLICCRWIENGESTEDFIEILHREKADDENIHFQLMDCLKKENIQLSKLILMALMVKPHSLGNVRWLR